MSQISQPMPMTYQDDPNVTETFVDAPIGVNLVSGNMHITFFTTRLDHGSMPLPPQGEPMQQVPQIRRVTLRLVIPVPGAVDLQNTIGNMLQMLRNQGLITATPIVQGPQTRQ